MLRTAAKWAMWWMALAAMAVTVGPPTALAALQNPEGTPQPALPGAPGGVSTLTFEAVEIEGKDGAPQGRVYAGPEQIMTLAGYGRKSVSAAEEVARRLNELAEEGLQASEISLVKERRTRLIMARGRRVLVVDKTMAAAQGSQLDDLGRAWTENLRSAFSQPYLSMKPQVVPAGETRALPLKGNLSGQPQVRVEAPIAIAVWDEASGVVRVSGMQEGDTRLVVFDDANVLSVPLVVMKYAARWTELPAARVTGDPASPDVVARAVEAVAAASTALEPGAWTTITPSAEGLRSVPRGESAEVPVSLAASGDHYLPCRIQPRVVVRNEPLDLKPVTVLMVSNRPEKLAEHGLWFEGKVEESQPARLLYHHVNATDGKADLVVELWNPGPTPVWVHVVEGVGGPSYDESWAGHRAAGSFLRKKAGGAGWMAPVAGGTAAPVVVQAMGKGATVSGLLELRVVGPSTVTVRLYLTPHMLQRLPRPIGSYQESPLLGQWHYLEPRREVKAQYTFGQQWTFVTIGGKAASGVVTGDELRGGYGILYDIEMELVNPTAQEVRVALVMEPAGGPARGALLVDGRLVEAAMLTRDAEAPVARYQLSPGEVRRVRVQTMPEAGSNYPVRLVARPG